MKTILTIIITFSAFTSAVLSKEQKEASTLTFKNTQQLDPTLEGIIGMTSAIDIDWDKIINLPKPPDNRIESLYIQRLQTQLDEPRKQRIKEQVDFNYTYFHKLEDKPKTQHLCDLIQNELVTVILAKKLKFDRVRPSFVNNNIKLVIENPKHPAYPSGHATQSHLFAYVLASLDSVNGKQYIATAKEVTVNREYAGVHYRSDSYVGKLLAKAMIKELVKNDKFVAMYMNSAEEWGPKDQSIKRLKIFTALASSK